MKISFYALFCRLLAFYVNNKNLRRWSMPQVLFSLGDVGLPFISVTGFEGVISSISPWLREIADFRTAIAAHSAPIGSIWRYFWNLTPAKSAISRWDAKKQKIEPWKPVTSKTYFVYKKRAENGPVCSTYHLPIVQPIAWWSKTL